MCTRNIWIPKKTSGIVKIKNTDLETFIKEHKEIGVSIENPAVYPYLTAQVNLEIQEKLIGKHREDNAQKILNLVGLKGNNLKVEKYSLGMKQRLALGLALVGEPSILILDEPFNGLDPIVVEDMINLLKQLKEEGITIIISSHMIDDLLELVDVIDVMKNGSIIKEIYLKELVNTDIKKYLLSLMKEENR